MQHSIKRFISMVLILCTLLTLTTTAFAAESTGRTVTSGNVYQPSDTSLPLYSTVLEQDEDEENKQTRDEDATYRFMQMWNDLFSMSNALTSRSSKTPIALRIESNVYVTERVPTPPLINQCDYPNDPYGKYGSIASHGCGIACLTMVASYLLDTELDIVEMAKEWGHYNTVHGSYWILFEDSAEALGLGFQERTYDTDKVMEALANGQMVVALQGKGLFTGGGHYILLTGLTEDGKITVNDPNGGNWKKNRTLRTGFEEGFKPSQIWADGGPYWIYDVKQLQVDTLNDERVTVTYQLKVND